MARGKRKKNQTNGHGSSASLIESAMRAKQDELKSLRKQLAAEQRKERRMKHSRKRVKRLLRTAMRRRLLPRVEAALEKVLSENEGGRGVQKEKKVAIA